MENPAGDLTVVKTGELNNQQKIMAHIVKLKQVIPRESKLFELQWLYFNQISSVSSGLGCSFPACPHTLKVRLCPTSAG